MLSPATLSNMFRSGDLPYRPRYLAQYWIVSQIRHDPPRCVEVYRHLRDFGGTAHASDWFLAMLTVAHNHPMEFREVWLHQRRPTACVLPGSDPK
jgi:hypothetical protein